MRFVLLAVLAGCPGPDTDDSDPGTDADTSMDTEGDTEVTVRFTGSVTTEDGTPIEGARVNMCRSVCFTVPTDASGAFTYEALPAETYSLHVEPLTEGLVDPHVPLPALSDRQLDIVVPDEAVSTALPSSRGWVSAAPGLELQLAQDDLEILFEDNPTEIGGTRVDDDDWLPIEGLNGTVLDMWYVHPWGATTPDGVSIGVRIANDTGVQVGTVYELWQANYDDVEWVKIGDVTADMDWFTGTGTIEKIETLALVQPAE